MNITFIQKLNVCLKSLDLGIDIVTSSGHTLSWSPDHEAPGFLMKRVDEGDKVEEVIMQIDSDGAWQFLVHHARKMDFDTYTAMAANLTLNETKRKG